MSDKESGSRRFNLVDLGLIIVILIVVFAFSGVLFFPKKDAPTVTVQYTLKVENVSADDAMDVFATVFFDNDYELKSASDGASLGKIVGYSTDKAAKEIYVPDKDRIAPSPLPEKAAMYFSVKVDCEIRNGVPTAGNNVIAAGDSLDVLLPFSYENTVVTSVTRV